MLAYLDKNDTIESCFRSINTHYWMGWLEERDQGKERLLWQTRNKAIRVKLEEKGSDGGKSEC